MADRPPRPSVSQALAVIRSNLAPLGVETIGVADALGRILAQPAHAAMHVPRFDASAMDGYALRSVDVEGASPDTPVSLMLDPLIAAGRLAGTLQPGHAAAIATGAPIPDGADCVLLREAAMLTGDRVAVAQPIAMAANVRRRGEDARSGQQVLPVGARIGAEAVGALIAFGVDNVVVRRRPRLAILSTGSELRADAGHLHPAAIIDSNGSMIRAAAAELGLTCDRIGAVADEPTLIEAAIAQGMSSGADLILSTGGVSAGQFDLVRQALEQRGGRVLFHGVRMRPGKPLLFALLPDGRPYFGLPGNPVAALVAFRFFVTAAVRALMALGEEQGEAVPMTEPGRDGTTIFLRCRQDRDGAGLVRLDTALDQRSHVLSSVLAADAWLRIDRDDAPGATLFPKRPDLP
ncbi:gephyrin-like molybdotransferase Glp [uncultured Sphingomonas sp.]|uniref:molybdopterin molybdotransferase MoeA n=1 Tax=uncultured Sphingomonas sp. TaxID=158754 RepID=UPI0025CF02C1|nr:gephyrin-like molybdotransferase Glp [uncultured Sphingomonas sp.]